MRPKLNVTVGGTGKQKGKMLFLQINAQHGHSRVELSFEKSLPFPENHICTKGQLISKGLFGILNSSKKQTKTFDFTTMIDLFKFVFWKNLKT